jgi:putative ABC transport system ATP-binding protein
MIVLKAREVKKEFADGSEIVRVLQGVSLDVARGRVLALEGRSGSGKTTLLSILGCILSPSSGSLVIDSQPVDTHNPQQLSAIRKKSIGFVFQQFNLFPALSAKENVEYALNIRGVKDKSAGLEAIRMLEQVGLADRADFLPRDLSGGQKQRVAIARALVGNVPLILADEPTANLDTETGQQVLKLMRKLATEQDRAMVIVTHDKRVHDIADEVLTIKEGLLFEGRSE